MGFIGLSLGPQDPRGRPANCVTHRVDCWYMISWINVRKHSVSYLFMKFRFIHLLRFLDDNAWVFQRVSTNLNMNVCQAACRIFCRNAQSTLAAFCASWVVPIVTYESGERSYGCSCLKWTWSKVKVVLQIRAMCWVSSIVLQLNRSCFFRAILQFC